MTREGYLLINKLQDSIEFMPVNDAFPLKYDGNIDTEVAGAAYKRCKKEILDVFFAENGFTKWKTTAYVRLSTSGLLQEVNLQKTQFGGKYFTVNFSVEPLCLPRRLGIGVGAEARRLGCFFKGQGGDFWWTYGDYENTKVSFENIRDAARLFLLPWFDEFCAEENYIKMLLGDMDGEKQNYQNIMRMKALESEDRQAVILENIERLKLPKKIVQGVLD